MIDHLPTKGIVSLLALVISSAVIGCGPAPDYRDQRLAEFAKQSTEQQSQQNNRLADLVEQNAKSRQDFLEAHETLTTQINSQQSALDTARSQLEQDRKDIASQRHRDPIIAAAVQSVGVFLACLLPMAVAVFVIWQMQSQGPDESAVADLLVCEITSDKPLFLPSPALSALRDRERSVPRRWLGWLEPSATSDSFDRLLRRTQARRLGCESSHASARRS